jgi:hypothetical protein
MTGLFKQTSSQSVVVNKETDGDHAGKGQRVIRRCAADWSFESVVE